LLIVGLTNIFMDLQQDFMKNHISKFILISVISLLSYSCLGQTSISGKIEGAAGMKLGIAYYYGENLRAFDSLRCNENGEVNLVVPKYIPPSQMCILTQQNDGFQFFYDGKSLTFHTNISALQDSLNFIDSKGNTDFLKFTKYEVRYEKIKELLENMLDEYPHELPFYQEIINEYNLRQIDYEATLNKIITENQENLAGKYLMTRRKPFVSPNLLGEERKNFLKQHFFDKISFDDKGLLYTNAYPRLVIEYLELYANPNFDKKKLEISLIEGIKIIMSILQPYAEAYDMITEYLLDGFQNFGFERVVQFISERYEQGNCINTNPHLTSRIEISKRLSPGSPAPEIKGKDLRDHEIKLSNYKGNYVLLIFWGSWCNHCSALLPKIASLYARPHQKKWEIITVVIDTNLRAVEDSVRNNHYTWPVIADGKGWDTPPAIDYGINVTPAMFFIGPDLNIIAKPSDFSEVLDLALTYGLIKINSH